MTIAGDKLTALLKHDSSIHIIAPESGIDYYGGLELSEEEQAAGRPDGVLTVRLDIPIEKFVNTPAPGQIFQCHLTGAGCVYHFASAFRAASPLPDTIWYMEIPGSAERIQLRNFVRIPIPIAISVKLPGDHGSLKDFREVPLIDISGGGLAFVHKEPLILGSPVVVRVPDLPHIGTLETSGTILRSTPVETNHGTKYHIGVSFGDALHVREQERLVQSVYQLQQSYLRKGLKIPQFDHTRRR